MEGYLRGYLHFCNYCLKEALEVFRYAEKLGVERDMAVFNALIQTLQAAGKWGLAIDVLRESSDENFISEAELLTAEEAFRLARDVYSIGLEDGTISRWYRDADGRLVLDLHRLPLSVAVTAVSLVFERMMKSSISGSCVRIITGKGKHVNNSGTRGVLKTEIEAFITEGIHPPGILTVEKVPGNEGCIDVPLVSVEKWISARKSNAN